MKEYEFIFEEELSKGLRRDDEGFEESPVALTECFNVVPIDKGVELHEALTSMDAASITWKS